MSSAATLSEGIAGVLGIFPSEISDADVIEIDAANTRHLVGTLNALQQLAVQMEMELRCLRDMEAGQEVRAFLDTEAGAHLADMLQETQSKVIRPNFGRKQ